MRSLGSATFMRKKLTLLIAAGALAVAVAGCGTSRAPGVVTVPSGGPTASSTTTTTTTSSTTTAADITPKTGPLSKEPTIAKPSGPAPKKLVVKNLVTGTGATVKSGDTITVNYVGAIYKTGKVFQATWTSHQTFTTPLSGVIPGWTKGLVGMKVGGRRQLIIPPSLAYKNEKQTGIPANSTLIFDVDLLKVTK
jgi:peptidylprolyl isomerase